MSEEEVKPKAKAKSKEPVFDESAPYGNVVGPTKARYFQNGQYFTADKKPCDEFEK